MFILLLQYLVIGEWNTGGHGGAAGLWRRHFVLLLFNISHLLHCLSSSSSPLSLPLTHSRFPEQTNTNVHNDTVLCSNRMLYIYIYVYICDRFFVLERIYTQSVEIHKPVHLQAVFIYPLSVSFETISMVMKTFTHEVLVCTQFVLGHLLCSIRFHIPSNSIYNIIFFESYITRKNCS